MLLRKQPADFIVHELTTPTWEACLTPSAGPFAVFEVAKASLTTPDAASHLARMLGVRAGAVAYAGLKDKHAQTAQCMTVQGWAPPSDGPRTFPLSASKPESTNTATFLGFATRAVAPKDIAANRFTITIRDLERKHYQLFLQRLRLLAQGCHEPDSLCFANYFGDQRFGSARHGKGFAGEALLKGDFETALRLTIATPDRKDTGVQRTFTRTCIASWGQWQALAKSLPRTPHRAAIELLAACPQPPTQDDFRRAFAALPYTLQELVLDAHQSSAWNNALAALLRTTAPDAASAAPPNSPPLSLTTDFGELLFPAPIPLPLRTRELALPFADAAIPNLRRPTFATGTRPCCTIARHVALSPASNDTLCTRPKPRLACTLRCELPSASYVTTLLRAMGQH
jgi:tRNA pseudouridine13 synthase